MFHTIRQNALNSGFVLIRMLDVLTKVAQVERITDRLAAIARHAKLAFDVGFDNRTDPTAKADLLRGWELFQTVVASTREL